MRAASDRWPSVSSLRIGKLGVSSSGRPAEFGSSFCPSSLKTREFIVLVEYGGIYVYIYTVDILGCHL